MPDPLIITADDFGAHAEINEGVERAHRHGVLTAASLMVGGPAAADAVARARRLPGLDVGLHVTLSGGPPVLPPEEVPDLIDAEGRLHLPLVRLLTPAIRRQVGREIRAQIAAFGATGLTLSHVDAHQHLHLHPVMGAELLAAMVEARALVRLRLPDEPPELLDTEDIAEAQWRRLLRRPWLQLLARRMRAAGLPPPCPVAGLAWSGAMTEDRLLRLLARRRPGPLEVYLHPATGPAHLPPVYRPTRDLAALLSPRVREAVTGVSATTASAR